MGGGGGGGKGGLDASRYINNINISIMAKVTFEKTEILGLPFSYRTFNSLFIFQFKYFPLSLAITSIKLIRIVLYEILVNFLNLNCSPSISQYLTIITVTM